MPGIQELDPINPTKWSGSVLAKSSYGGDKIDGDRLNGISGLKVISTDQIKNRNSQSRKLSGPLKLGGAKKTR